MLLTVDNDDADTVCSSDVTRPSSSESNQSKAELQSQMNALNVVSVIFNAAAQQLHGAYANPCMSVLSIASRLLARTVELTGCGGQR